MAILFGLEQFSDAEYDFRDERNGCEAGEDGSHNDRRALPGRQGSDDRLEVEEEGRGTREESGDDSTRHGSPFRFSSSELFSTATILGMTVISIYYSVKVNEIGKAALPNGPTRCWSVGERPLPREPGTLQLAQIDRLAFGAVEKDILADDQSHADTPHDLPADIDPIDNKIVVTRAQDESRFASLEVEVTILRIHYQALH